MSTNLLQRIEALMLDGSTDERDYRDFQKKKKNYINDMSLENKAELTLAYAKVYENLKLCRVGHLISMDDFHTMADYLIDDIPVVEREEDSLDDI